jgi:hypothetical protein
MKVLIIHHLEMMWEPGYNGKNTDFYTLARKTVQYIKRAKPDKVILTRFEDWQPGYEHYESGLADYVTDWEEYGYGWDREMFDDSDEEGIVWADGGHHSEVVLLTDWMRELKGHKVSISGAFDGECIEDLEYALNALNIPFKRVESLIV